jgi:hypothetical protein
VALIFLMLQIAAAWCIGWWGRGRWSRAVDTTAQARIEVLEAELAHARESVAVGSAVYLKRLAWCRGCATCNPEPADLGEYYRASNPSMGRPISDEALKALLVDPEPGDSP